MICPKCGTLLKSTAKFCKQCGTQVNTTTEVTGTHSSQYQYQFNYSNHEKPKYNVDSLEGHEKQYDYSYNYSNHENPKYNLNSSHQEQDEYNYIYSKFNYIPTQTTGDEKYLEAYVGPSYKSLKNSKISIGTIFLGIFYIIYRKLYSLALIYFLLTLSSNVLLGEYSNIVNIIIRIFIAFKFNELYLAHAERKVEQIKQSNFDKTSTELLDECRKKGGVALTPAIILTIIIMTLMPLLTAIIKDVYIEKDTTEVIKNEKQNTSQIKDLSFSTPDILLPVSTSEEYHSYYYNGSADCLVTLRSQNNNYLHTTAENYLEKSSYGFGPYASATDITTNKSQNVNWKKIQIRNEDQEFQIYAVMKDDILYTIEVANSQTYSKKCSKVYKDLVNTTKFTN